MNRLRIIFDWIVKRKFLSLIFAALFIGIIITARIAINAYSGELSAPIQRGKIIDAIYGYGTVTTDRSFSINPQGKGIDKIFFKEGDIVKKDMPLLQTTDRVVVRAPFSGIIHLVPYKVRENTYAKEPRIVLTDITDRYILVSLEQEQGTRVKVGQKVQISFDSFGQKYFSGTVSSISLKATHHLIQIKPVDLPEAILPGMTCNVDILLGERENALLIPLSSLKNGHVWVKRGNSFPREVSVGLGVIDKHWAEVKSGDIQVGDRVKIRTF